MKNVFFCFQEWSYSFVSVEMMSKSLGSYVSNIGKFFEWKWQMKLMGMLSWKISEWSGEGDISESESEMLGLASSSCSGWSVMVSGSWKKMGSGSSCVWSGGVGNVGSGEEGSYSMSGSSVVSLGLGVVNVSLLLV